MGRHVSHRSAASTPSAHTHHNTSHSGEDTVDPWHIGTVTQQRSFFFTYNGPPGEKTSLDPWL